MGSLRSQLPLTGAAPAVAATAAACLLGVLVASISPSVDAVLIGAIAMMLCVPVVVRVVQGRFDPFEPLVIFALAYGTMFVVRPAAMALADARFYSRPTRTVDVAATFTPMLALALAGAVAFFAGYGLRLGARLAARMRAPGTALDLRATTAAALVVAGLGAALFLVFIVQGGGRDALRLVLAGRSAQYYELLSGSSKYLYFGPWLLAPASLSLYALGHRYGQPALKAAAAATFLMLLVRSGPIGSRITLLPTIGGFFVLRYLMRGTRPSGRVVVAALVAAVIASGIIGTARNADARTTAGLSGVVAGALENPASVVQPLTEGADNSMSAVFAAGLTVVPDATGWWQGRAVIGDLLLRPIPRALWPDKPQPPRLQVVSLLWPAERAGTIANPEFSVVFLFFMDFGLAGVIGGMAAIGVACRVLFEYHRRHRDSLFVQIVFAMGLFFIVIGIRDSPVDTLSRMAFAVVPLWLIFRAGSIRRAFGSAGR